MFLGREGTRNDIRRAENLFCLAGDNFVVEVRMSAVRNEVSGLPWGDLWNVGLSD